MGGHVFVQIGNGGTIEVKQLSELDNKGYIVRSVSLHEIDGVDDASLIKLRHAVYCHRFELKGTQVTAQGVADLQKAFPNCNVQR